MKKYDPKEPCPKCGQGQYDWTDVWGVEHRSIREKHIPAGWFRQEHMRCWCGECGAVWKRAPLDAVPVGKALAAAEKGSA